MPKTRLATLSALSAGLSLLTPLTAHAQQTSAITLSGGIVERASDNGDTSYVLGYTFTVDAPIAVTALGFYDDNNTAQGQPIGVISDAAQGQPAAEAAQDQPPPGTAMSASHSVGIFSDATGTLLVQATVAPTDTPYAAFSGQQATAAQSAADGTGVQLFRYDSALKGGATGLLALPSFVLTPGQTYTIAAVTGADEYDELPGSDFAGGTFGNSSPVTYGQDRFVDGDATTLQDPADTTQNNPGGFPGNGYFGPNFLFTPLAAAPEPSQSAAFAVGLLGLGALALKARRSPRSGA